MPGSEKATYRVGMIGCGRKGHGHARGYEGNPQTEIVAAADPDPENLEIFLKRFPVRGYSDYHEMLEKEDIVIDCARAGVKAVYCEKPMAASLEEADRMVEECRSRGIHLAAGDAYRNMSQHWKVLDLIKSGEVGDVQSMNLYQATDEISGGGCQGLSVMRMFAHDADVDWVTGWVSGDPFSDEDQSMGGYVRFVNDIECFIHFKPAAKKGIEVICSKGVYFTDWGNGSLWRKVGSDLKEIEDFFDDTGGAKDWMMPSGSRQRDGTQSIVESLEQGIEPRCSGDNHRKVLEVAIGLRESHRNGHAPVRFPIQDRTLRIVPHQGRYLNKKEVYGEEWYAEAIHASSTRPLGGAKV